MALFKTVLCGVGFLSDAYDLFIINTVKNVLATIYQQTPDQASSIGTAALVGAVLGQLFFGTLADRLGRRAIFVTTISLVIFGALGSATCVQNGTFDIYSQLSLWRFILGFGIGGEYPLAATVSAEGSSNEKRGKAVSAVFSMQGAGNILASLVMYILLAAGAPLDATWRIALALGALPGLLTVYWRYQMEESHHFKRVAAQDRATLFGSSESLTGAPSGGIDSDGPFATSTTTTAAPVRSGTKNMAMQVELASMPARSVKNPLNQAGMGVEGSPATPTGMSPPQLSEDVAARRAAASGDLSVSMDGVGSQAAATSEPATHLESEETSMTIGNPVARQSGSRLVASTPPAQTKLPRATQAFSWKLVKQTLRTIWEFRWTLLGTAGSWFIFDVIFYANGIFSATVLDDIGFSSGKAGSQTEAQLATLALGNMILSCIGLPGYFVAIALIDKMGRKNMQYMGFIMEALIFAIMAGTLGPLEANSKPAFVFLYGLTFFFSNFGANTSTFVIPAEAFPTRAKATCHGISAASGKSGAALGAAAMAPLLTIYGTSTDQKNQGLVLVLSICAGLSGLGWLWTWAFTKETGGLRIEDLDALGVGGARAPPVVRSVTNALRIGRAGLPRRLTAAFSTGGHGHPSTPPLAASDSLASTGVPSSPTSEDAGTPRAPLVPARRSAAAATTTAHARPGHSQVRLTTNKDYETVVVEPGTQLTLAN